MFNSISGAGTDADPFRRSVEGGIENISGDVTLTWAGQVTQVQIIYRAADDKNESDIGQHIGVGKFGVHLLSRGCAPGADGVFRRVP